MLDPGDLRHVVKIQQKTNTQDPTTGEITESWSDIHAQVFAAITPVSAREFMASQSEQANYSARIVIRYRAGLDATMRIVGLSGPYNGRIFNPSGWLSDPDYGNEYLTAPCSEGVNEG